MTNRSCCKVAEAGGEWMPLRSSRRAKYMRNRVAVREAFIRVTATNLEGLTT